MRRRNPGRRIPEPTGRANREVVGAEGGRNPLPTGRLLLFGSLRPVLI